MRRSAIRMSSSPATLPCIVHTEPNLHTHMHPGTRTGRLYYVMGPSGVGKDSLMRYARERLADSGRVLFAHRYITRPMQAGGENHVELSETEFLARRARGCFALAWQAHGRHYGVGREIDLWLSAGVNVAVNGSRESFEEAQARYPKLAGVLVEASPEALAARLAGRGREDAPERQARLTRAALLVPKQDAVIRIANDGPLEQAGERLVSLLDARGPGHDRVIPL